jgi:hypothetical protein
MDGEQVARLRDALKDTGWWARALSLGAAVRRTQSAGGLYVVGTPGHDPWHLTAHLDDEARYSGLSQIRPTLVRWSPPAGAPAHLAVGIGALERAGRGETVFVVSPDTTPDPLLERIAHARTSGATVLSVDGGDAQLDDLVHERMTIAGAGLLLPGATRLSDARDGNSRSESFDLAQHLVSSAAATLPRAGSGSARGSFGDRLAALLGSR